jgi:hypothetical protein
MSAIEVLVIAGKGLNAFSVHSTQAHSLLAVFEQLGLLAVCMQLTCSMQSVLVIADRQSCLQ